MIDPNTGQDNGSGDQSWWDQNAPPAQADPVSTTGVANPLDPSYRGDTGIVGPSRATVSAPSGGNLRDPAYAKQLVDYYASQPGANPSLRNDPNYWVGKITSGELGSDTNYIVGKFMTPEGAPAGSSSFGGYGGGNPAGFGAPPAPYISAPSTVPPYVTPAMPAALQTPYVPPAVPSSLQAPYVGATFTPPTGITAENDPGYLERAKLGLDLMERSAAARGSVLGGSFQQGLNRYAQDYASNEYSNVYNRALNTAGFNANQALGARQQNQGEYQNLVGNALMGRQQNQGEYQNVVGNAQNQYGNQYNAYLNDQSRQLNQYLTNYGIGHTAQSDYWNRLMGLHNSGLNAAQTPTP